MSTAAAERDWCDALPDLLREAAKQLPRSPRTALFRFGDAVLEVVSDYEPLFHELEAVYGDCGGLEHAGGACRIRCTVTLLRSSPLLSLSFDGAPVRDPVEIALVPYRFRRHQPYVETPSPISGWRLVVNANAGNRLLIASDARTALINLDQAPPEFVLDCIVGVMQSAQSGVLFLHAASVGIAGSGALLIAPSCGGKSTTALSLASRGHDFLGDDVAAIRLATREILPFPKSAGLREGPLARILDARVRASRHVRISGRHGIPRTIVRVSDLFPWSKNGPLPLRFAFVLDRLTDAATITPLQPSFRELKRLRKMVVMETMSSWGMSPGRDLMQLLIVINVLSDLRCYLVELGSIEETASLIENAMQA